MTRLAACFAVALFLALPAFGRADENKASVASPHEDKVGAAAGHSEQKHAEPAVFDLPARWDLSIYTLIVFGVLFFVLSYFAWPLIQRGMKEREDAILNARDDALKAKHDAEAIRADLLAQQAKAHDTAREIVEEARRDAEKLRASEREAGVKEAAAERDRAMREINTAKDQALQEIYQKSVQLAALMSSKALRRTMTADDHSRLIDESLSELKATA